VAANKHDELSKVESCLETTFKEERTILLAEKTIWSHETQPQKENTYATPTEDDKRQVFNDER